MLVAATEGDECSGGRYLVGGAPFANQAQVGNAVIVIAGEIVSTVFLRKLLCGWIEEYYCAAPIKGSKARVPDPK
jgi:hypothetical protein